MKKFLEIGPDDWLLEISGTYNKDNITSLTFVTYRGKIKTVNEHIT